MPNANRWLILGNNPVADQLRRAAREIPILHPLTVATSPDHAPDDAFVFGPAAIETSTEWVVPYFAGLEAVEHLISEVHNMDGGRIYGSFTSLRIQRGVSSEIVMQRALLPAVTLALDILRSPVKRVHASSGVMVAGGDSFFVTLRHADESISTIEAMAVLFPSTGASIDLVCEVTTADSVLRAEPMRPSVTVESAAAARKTYPWWEDLDDRYLRLIVRRSTLPHDHAGTRLRRIWAAVLQSVESGESIEIDEDRGS